MYRLSEDIYNEFVKEAEEEFKKCISAKERGEEPDYRKMNAYICLDARLREIVAKGLQKIEETGWFE